MNEQMFLESSSKPTYHGTGITLANATLSSILPQARKKGLMGRDKKNLKLKGSYLLHSQHVDAKVGQVLSQVGVQDHVVLIIREHI